VAFPDNIRQMTRRLLLFLAVGVALPDARAGLPLSIGTWEYSGARFRLSVHLWENGNCLVSAQSSRAATTSFFECTYTVRGDTVLLESRQNQGDAHQPARLYYDALGDSLMVDGEPDRVLVRMKE